jgi:hypothetical protein
MTLSPPAAPTPVRINDDPDPSADSIFAAVAYADLFSFPLTAAEIVRYQVNTSLGPLEVGRVLGKLVGEGRLVERGGLYALQGREKLFVVRERREARSGQIWRRALRYEGLLGRIPFVRMVAVTGALAVNNINGRADIDLLVIAVPGRVWICRRLLVVIVRLGRLLGDDLCPNYILSADKLALDQQDFFTAHELAQMVPLFGGDLHRRMLAANPWAWRYLPAAHDLKQHDDVQSRKSRRGEERGVGVRVLERLLSHPAFDRWERWELGRLRQKLRAEVGDAAEVVCTPEQCKGHTGLHRKNILHRYGEKLQQLGIGSVFDRGE